LASFPPRSSRSWSTRFWPRSDESFQPLMKHGWNDYGLESAQPDLKSVFKKPGCVGAELWNWERVRDGLSGSAQCRRSGNAVSGRCSRGRPCGVSLAALSVGKSGSEGHESGVKRAEVRRANQLPSRQAVSDRLVG
jgi:hypothetical protein